MPEEWHKKIQPFVSRARTIVSRSSVPLKDGVHIVPHKRARDMMSAINNVRQEYRETIAELASHWPEIVDALRVRVVREAGQTSWDDLSPMIPDEDKLVSLFDIETSFWPVGGAGSTGVPLEVLNEIDRLRDKMPSLRDSVLLLRDSRDPTATTVRSVAESVEALILAANQAMRKITQENLDSWIEEAQEVTNRLVAQAVESMVDEPVKEFAEAVKNLEQLQEREGRCRTGTIEMIQRAYSKLMDFQFMIPRELIVKLKQVEAGLGGLTPRDVNTQSSTAARLSGALRSVSEELKSGKTRSEGLQQFARAINV
jgi:hypothetical protein